MNPEALLELFRTSGALLDGHFRLTSGLHSPGYLQCALVLQHPPHAESLGRAIAGRTRDLTPTVVLSPALGGVVIGHEVARALGVRAIFAERQDGRLTLRRGFSVTGRDRVLVVEDVLTTGGSTREVIEVMRHHDAKPAAIGAIVNRSGGNPFAKDGLELFALAEVEVKTWKPEDCPLCRTGGSAVKPGSRLGAGARV